jgi:hypothetical protein
VLLKPPDGAREKLRMPITCTYTVVEISGDKYSTQDLLTHKVADTHVSNLSEFRYDSSSGLDPIEVAVRNAGEFFIDRTQRYYDKTFEHGVSGILERLLTKRRHLGTVQGGLQNPSIRRILLRESTNIVSQQSSSGLKW